jgi:alpha-tubulin suppressor-like RCC1 family protein
VSEGGVTPDAGTSLVGGLLTAARDGPLFCWGGNGQLGDGTIETRARPVRVAGLAGRVVAVETGVDHSSAITLESELWCWGDNSAGTASTMVEMSDGAVLAWGRNGEGQLGNGSQVDRPAPTRTTAFQAIGNARCDFSESPRTELGDCRPPSTPRISW